MGNGGNKLLMNIYLTLSKIMAYVVLSVTESMLESARKDYQKIIWQSDDLRGFNLKFQNPQEKEALFAHVDRLDIDQCDWLTGLPEGIQFQITSCKDENCAYEILHKMMRDTGYAPC
jgi:hypothetical protein